MIAAMSLLATVTRASSGRCSTLGTMSAASTPRITMTTRISISVKPGVRRRARRRCGGVGGHRTIIMRPITRGFAPWLLHAIRPFWPIASSGFPVAARHRRRRGGMARVAGVHEAPQGCPAARTRSTCAQDRRCPRSRATSAPPACCRSPWRSSRSRSDQGRRPRHQGRKLRDRIRHHAAAGSSPSSRRATSRRRRS